jgi:hypothetical protein
MTLDEMWERLAQHQPFADARGFGSEWARMLEERTQDTVWEAAYAAEQAAEVAWVPVSEAVWANFPEAPEDDAALDAARAATYLAEEMVEMAGTAWAALRAAEGKNMTEKMWERLVQHQPYANQRFYSEVWARMCAERTQEAADAAAMAIDAPSITAWCHFAGSFGSASAWRSAAAIAAAMTSLAVAHASDNERRTFYARQVIQWIEKAEGKNND